MLNTNNTFDDMNPNRTNNDISTDNVMNRAHQYREDEPYYVGGDQQHFDVKKNNNLKKSLQNMKSVLQKAKH